MKNTVATFAAAKAGGGRIAMLTAYDYSVARLVDEGGADAILVGDSLGMVMLGYEDTVSVTMEDMIHHTRAVARGARKAMVVADLPFLSYHLSVAQAVENAGRLMQQGRAQAVKLEGGSLIAPQIRAIVDASIPVMGHIGLTPQSVNALGGFKVQGRDVESVRQLIDDAKAVEDAGAFAVVVECVPARVAERLTAALSIPTIGIGAGPGCDGQVLVYQDMLGMFDGFVPKFVKRFAEAGEVMRKAFADYVAGVKDGSFPGPEHVFSVSDDVLENLY